MSRSRKVVLVYPNTGFDVVGESVDLPMGVLTAASLLTDDYDVVITDQRTDADWQTHLVEQLNDDTVCVGISCMTGPQIKHALKAAELVKQESYVPVVFGGVHPTLLPHQTVQHPWVDYVVVGEGEQTFRDLVDALAVGAPMEAVQGSSRKFVDLNNLPPLPYHLVDVTKYVGEQGRFRDTDARTLIFFTARGCPYHCSYCCNEELHHGTWRAMDVELVYQRAATLVDWYDLDGIMFHDEDLFCQPKRVRQLASLINNDFLWWAQVRMDSALRVDLDYLYSKGLRYIQAGIESGSPRVLKMIRKGETVDTMLKANRELARTPIKPLYNFMMGFPGETYQDMMQTADVALQLLEENPNAEMTGFYSYVPYPGTPLYAEALKLGFQPPTTLEDWANFTRQSLQTPWQQQNASWYWEIMTMSKFLDGTRMVRRMQHSGEIDSVAAARLAEVTKSYREKWDRHDFTNELDRMFNW